MNLLSFLLCLCTLPVIVVVVFVLRLIIENYVKGRVKCAHSVPCHKGGHPILGMLSTDPTKIPMMMYELSKKYGESTNYSYWMGPMPILHIQRPEDISFILGKGQHHFGKTPVLTRVAHWLIGNSLLLATGEQWKRARKLFNPAFHFDVVNKTAPIVQSRAQILISIIDKHIEKGESFDIQTHFMNVTQDVVGLIAFGYDFQTQLDDTGKYRTAFSHLMDEVLVRKFRLIPDFVSNFIPHIRKQMQKAEQAKATFIAAIDKCIEARLNEKKQGGPQIERYDILEFCLNAEKNGEYAMTRKEMYEQLLLMLFAGTDTTGFLLSAAVNALCDNPSILEKLLNEIDEVVGKELPSAEVVLNKMPYLNGVLRETLRLTPSAPVVGRAAIEAVTLPSGLCVPNGMNCVVCPYTVHRSARFWGEDVLEFKPERWSKERPNGGDKDVSISTAFIPFVAGQRNCIGQNVARLESAMVLVMLLQRFKFSRVPDGEVELDHFITFSFRNGLRVTATKR